MNTKKCTGGESSDIQKQANVTGAQKIMVFQQNKSGEKKIAGIRKYGGQLIKLEVVSIDTPLPAVIDDANTYLPREIKADLVLDFLKHPDLSLDLATKCSQLKIPVVASGKKLRVKGVLTPPT